MPVERWFSNRTTLPDAISLAMDADATLALIPPRFEEAVEELVPEKGPEHAIGFFSSGTTGLPKVHFIDRRKLSMNAVLSARQFGLKPHDRVLILASPWHIAGFTWFCAAEKAGAEVQIRVPHIDHISSFATLISSFQPTVLFAVPSVIHALVQQGMPYVPHIIAGGAPIALEDLEKLNESCSWITQAYGQTEAGGLLSSVTFPADQAGKAFLRNAGFPPAEIVLSCAGTQDNPQPVLAQSPTAIVSGQYETGDLGWTDASGALYVVGRKESRGNCNSLSGISMVLHK